MDITQILSPSGGDEEFHEDGSGQVHTHADSLDDILDEIDSVLETNAQAFVQGFVQKGGQ